MVTKRRQASFSLKKSLEFIGKPILLLITFLGILAIALIKLYKVVVHRLGAQKPHPTRFTLVFTSVLVLQIVLGGLFYWYILKDLPSPHSLKDSKPAQTTKILDRNGRLLYEIYGNENRTLISLSSLPQYLVQATIASEDRDFYSHHGVAIRGILRATSANLKRFLACQFSQSSCQMTIQGGSTLTQQLVKNSLLTPEKTLSRKLKELVLALEVERLYTKDQILEMYFNYVPYGGVAFGVEAAAKTYFDKSASDLTLEESALIAGLPVAPTTMSPFGAYPYLAKTRQEQVLDAMAEVGYLTPGEAQSAKTKSLAFKPGTGNILAPHFVMYIKSKLATLYGEDLVSRGGLEVTTTLDLATQKVLEQAITSELSRLKNLNVQNGAGLVIEPKTGQILALVGSRDFFAKEQDGQVNVVVQLRQPGSAIKPLTYALAFMNGLQSSSQIEDSPICFRQAGQKDYCPKNYDGKFHGQVTLKRALASSYNIPAIKLLSGLGVSKLVNFAKSLGITTWGDESRFGLALTLGGGDVTMLDLAQAYSVFATGGDKIPLTWVLAVKDSSGKDLTPHVASPTREVIPKAVAYQISDILSDRAARAPAFGYNSILNIKGHTVAVKTGTTNALRDNWTIGYTRDRLVAVWVGNNDNSPMSQVASGITGASPIWSSTMTTILKDYPNKPLIPEENLVAVKICQPTGMAYCDNLCPSRGQVQYFVKGTEPKLDCLISGTLTKEASSISRSL